MNFKKAACRGVDTNIFFSEVKGGTTHQTKRVIEKYCNRCEAKEECLAYALDHRIQYGIWGGYSARGRVRLARQIRNARPA